jgi:ribosomal protein RSM22 (predicted rRNA methylase)
VQLPPEIISVVEEISGRVSFANLKQACAALTAHYRGRGVTARLSLTPEEKLAAYLVTRMPATYAAASAVLRELHRRLGDPSVISLLDLGAGPGAASLAARAAFPALERFTLIEPDRDFARAATRIMPGADVWTVDARRCEFPETYDLVLASYMAGELSETDRNGLVERAWKGARVAMVIIEPGSPAGFAVVRAVREQLLDLGAHIAAPCPREGRCPIPEGDWCHFAQRVERSSLHRRMKDAALGYEDEKFSYIAATRCETHRAVARIIRRPEQSPDLVQLSLCAGDALRAERVTRRNPQLFRAARKAGWGDEWNPES